LSDDRRSPEELEIEQAAKVAPPPPRRTEPCRRYIDVPPVSAEEIEEFVKELESK
jgi:hypothetical protein